MSERAYRATGGTVMTVPEGSPAEQILLAAGSTLVEPEQAAVAAPAPAVVEPTPAPAPEPEPTAEPEPEATASPQPGM